MVKDNILEALELARDTIKIWHGLPAWDLYQQSPEMKKINSVIKSLKSNSGPIKEIKIKSSAPVINKLSYEIWVQLCMDAPNKIKAKSQGIIERGIYNFLNHQLFELKQRLTIEVEKNYECKINDISEYFKFENQIELIENIIK